MDTVLKKRPTILLFLTPALLIYTAIVFVPIIWSGVYAFFNWNGVGEVTFAGWDNYKKMLFGDRYFWPVVKQTFVYTAIQLLIQVGGGLLVAILLNNLRRGRTLLQTIYYVPVVISSVAICQIFDKLFSVSPTGLINYLLSLINPEFLHIEWLSSPGLSLVTAAFVEGYKNMGIYMVIFFAALISVPEELSESARIDGANGFRIYWNIKLPYIRNIIIANSILVFSNSLRAFDIPFLLTGGGPGNSSQLMSSYMYKQAFSSMKYGYGSAIAVFIVVLCLLITSSFMHYFREGDGDL